MFGLNPWIILGVVLAFIGVGTAGYLKGHSNGVDTTTAAYEASLAKQRDEANAMLLANRDIIISRERELNAFNAKVETENADKQKYIDGLRVANGRLFAAAGGMYDKNGRPSGKGSGNAMPGDSPTPSSASGAAAGCRLSDELESFLSQRFKDADDAAIYAQTGHIYAIGATP